MKVVGLLSGGKDSCYNLCHAAKHGHEVVALATLAPPHGKDEIDSYMYQTVGHDAVHLVAEAFALPLYRQTITGSALNQTSSYGERLPPGADTAANGPSDEHDETEDLTALLLQVKAAHPDVEGVSVGAILSNYQRVRVEHVALRVNLKLLPLTYLWQRDQSELLKEMCDAGVEAVLIKVAGIGLSERHLGKTLAQLRPHLESLNDRYGSHVCGEGGEYETLTLDCPLFKRRIVLDEIETVIHSDNSFASVAYLRIHRAHLEDKIGSATTLDDVAVPPVLDWLGETTREAVAKALEASPAHVSECSTTRSFAKRQADGSAWPPMSSCQPASRPWLALANVNGLVDQIDNSETSSVESEVHLAFSRLVAKLAAHGLTLAHLSHINLTLASQADFGAMNAVYAGLFGSDPPSRACIAVASSSGTPTPRIVIDALALNDIPARASAEGGISSQRLERRVVHVQGRSYWAAANIGPYSQAVKADSRISIAGQIGLLPLDLTLATDPATQIALSLQHARRILAATLEARTEKRKGWVESCVCWLETPSGENGTQSKDARKLLAAASAAWLMQSAEAREESVVMDDDNVEDSWEARWLGQDTKHADLPTLYAFLPTAALPRGAIVEWQLTAHDGRAAQGVDQEIEHCEEFAEETLTAAKRAALEDQRDQEPEEAGPPTLSSGDNAFAGGSRVSYRVIKTVRGRSSFGIACCRLSDTNLEELSAELIRPMRDALSVRVLYRAVGDHSVPWTQAMAPLNALLALRPADQRPAITPVPVCGLYAEATDAASCSTMHEWDVALIWIGVN